MHYKHTQVGWFIIFTLGFAAIVTYFSKAPLSLVLTLIVVGALFSTLTVSIDAENVIIVFGPGLVSKKFKLKEIKSCQIAKSRCCSWGIHGWGKRWLFNVSGFNTIELIMINEMIYYIGTDEPAKLEKAINEQRLAFSN